MDFYLEQVTDLYDQVANLGVSHSCPQFLADSHAKQKIFDTITNLGGDLITLLCSDTNLRYLYTGPSKTGPGAPRQYDGKIDWDDPQELTTLL